MEAVLILLLALMLLVGVFAFPTVLFGFLLVCVWTGPVPDRWLPLRGRWLRVFLSVLLGSGFIWILFLIVSWLNALSANLGC